MARPRNEKLKKEIAHVAAGQFAERGYHATTYTSIARECGISRNLVQYHWPKKELLAIAYMEDVLARGIRDLGLSPDALTDDIEAITAVGSRFFETFLSQEGTRLFLQDVLAHRDLTEEVLAFNLTWLAKRISSPRIDGMAAQRTVITHMGGFYDLLYWCLKHGQPFDAHAELAPVVLTVFADIAGNGTRPGD